MLNAMPWPLKSQIYFLNNELHILHLQKKFTEKISHNLDETFSHSNSVVPPWEKLVLIDDHSLPLKG